jgi:hypothetical protein
MNASDRRRLERFDLKLSTKLFWVGENKEHNSVELMTSNICASGAYFITNDALSKGMKVKLDLILELNKYYELRGWQSHLNASGFVIRADHQGMAICFDNNCKISSHKVTDT